MAQPNLPHLCAYARSVAADPISASESAPERGAILALRDRAFQGPQKRSRKATSKQDGCDRPWCAVRAALVCVCVCVYTNAKRVARRRFLIATTRSTISIAWPSGTTPPRKAAGQLPRRT